MEKIMGSNLGFTIKSHDFFFLMIMFRTHIKLIKNLLRTKFQNQIKTKPLQREKISLCYWTETRALRMEAD